MIVCSDYVVSLLLFYLNYDLSLGNISQFSFSYVIYRNKLTVSSTCIFILVFEPFKRCLKVNFKCLNLFIVSKKKKNWLLFKNSFSLCFNGETYSANP